jgi:hypothetical protein
MYRYCNFLFLKICLKIQFFTTLTDKVVSGAGSVFFGTVPRIRIYAKISRIPNIALGRPNRNQIRRWEGTCGIVLLIAGHDRTHSGYWLCLHTEEGGAGLCGQGWQLVCLQDSGKYARWCQLVSCHTVPDNTFRRKFPFKVRPQSEFWKFTERSQSMENTGEHF